MKKLRTYIYIDGFNLFYGAVKGTPYKWLDFMATFKALLKPHNDIQAIKYFTAMVSGKWDPDAPKRQDTYIRALKKHIPEFSVYYGHFLTNPKLIPSTKKPHPLIEVSATEEKGSDVNLAIHLLNDAWLDKYDTAFVVSNDSDLAGAISIVRNQNKKNVGVINPGKRRVAAELQKNARPILKLREGVLKISQLPKIIPGTKIQKPRSW